MKLNLMGTIGKNILSGEGINSKSQTISPTQYALTSPTYKNETSQIRIDHVSK